MDLVVVLHCIETLRTECNGMPFTIPLGLLREDGTHSKVRTVSPYVKQKVIIRRDKNQLGGHSIFEGLKGSLLSISPLPGLIHRGEVKRRVCMV